MQIRTIPRKTPQYIFFQNLISRLGIQDAASITEMALCPLMEVIATEVGESNTLLRREELWHFGAIMAQALCVRLSAIPWCVGTQPALAPRDLSYLCEICIYISIKGRNTLAVNTFNDGNSIEFFDSILQWCIGRVLSCIRWEFFSPQLAQMTLCVGVGNKSSWFLIPPADHSVIYAQAVHEKGCFVTQVLSCSPPEVERPREESFFPTGSTAIVWNGWACPWGLLGTYGSLFYEA